MHNYDVYSYVDVHVVQFFRVRFMQQAELASCWFLITH